MGIKITFLRVGFSGIAFCAHPKANLIFAGHPFGLKKNAKPLVERSLLQITHKDDEGVTKNIVTLNRELSDDEKVLIPLNAKLKTLRIDFALPNYSIYKEHWGAGSSKLRHMSGTQLTRRFVGTDGVAGRLYGHWVQQCPSGLRRYLTFNRLPTVERDFSSMHLYLLYGLAGERPPEGDLYAFGHVDRDWMKSILTRSIGADSREEAIAALKKEMKEVAPKLMKRAESYFDRFWEHHQKVYDQLFNGNTWAKLQFLDSTIALKTLKILISNNIVCIPIHDSFIVQDRYAEQLEVAMVSAFNSLLPDMQMRIK